MPSDRYAQNTTPRPAGNPGKEGAVEKRVERFMSFIDRTSVVLAAVAIAGAILFIIGPALWTVWR